MDRKTRRQVLRTGATGLAALSAPALAACAGSGEPAVSLTVKQPVTLEIWDEPNIGGQPFYDKWLPLFRSAHPQVTLKYVPRPTDWTVKLPASIFAGTPPDASVAAGPTYGSMARDKQFMALDPYVKAAKYETGDYLPSVWAGMRHRDQTFSLPKYINNAHIFFNRDHFVRSGVPLPRDGWTHAQFLDAAQQLTRGPSDQREVWGVSCPWSVPTSWVSGLLWGQCAEFNDPKNPDAFTFSRRENVAAYQWVHDIPWKYQIGAKSNADRGGVGDRPALFQTGTVAMTVDGSAGLAAAVSATTDWDVAPLPKGPCGQRGLAAFGRYAIPVGVRAPEASWAVLTGVSSPEAGRMFVEAAGLMPARKSQVDFWAAAFPGKNVRAGLPAQDTQPDTFTHWLMASDVTAALTPIMERLFLKNDVSVVDALRLMQDAATAAAKSTTTAGQR